MSVSIQTSLQAAQGAIERIIAPRQFVLPLEMHGPSGWVIMAVAQTRRCASIRWELKGALYHVSCTFLP
jgi:hypothetical protein